MHNAAALYCNMSQSAGDQAEHRCIMYPTKVYYRCIMHPTTFDGIGASKPITLWNHLISDLTNHNILQEAKVLLDHIFYDHMTANMTATTTNQQIITCGDILQYGWFGLVFV